MPRAVKPWTWRRCLRDFGPEEPGLLLTLYTLGTFMDEEGFGFPGQETLAQGARACVRTVRRHIKAARERGWVAIELSDRGGRGWRRYVYRACVPDNVPLTERDEILADAVVSQFGEVEDDGADKAVSPPSSQRADNIVSPPPPMTAASKVLAECSKQLTCGHPEQRGADIPSARCGHSYVPEVRTQLVPTKSSSKSYRSSSREGAAQGSTVSQGIDFEDLPM